MKLKKALAMACAMALTAAIAIGGTIAYLQDSDKVVNTFTVGNVHIELDEAEVELDGTYKEDHDQRVKDNDYKLMPGHTYFKDPTVTILEGSESSYVRMLVTISKASAAMEVFGEDFLPENFVQGWNPTIWVPTRVVGFDTTNDTATYEFRYKEAVAAPDDGNEDKVTNVVLDDLFESFTIPGEGIDNDELNKLDGMTITVVAHAIQADGFDDADEAWDAFVEKTQG